VVTQVCYIYIYIHVQTWYFNTNSAEGTTYMFPPLWRCCPTRVIGLLIHEVSGSYTTTHHSRWNSPGRVISPSQRPLPGSTQPSQETNMPASGWIRTQNLSRGTAVQRCYLGKHTKCVSVGYGLVECAERHTTVGGTPLDE